MLLAFARAHEINWSRSEAIGWFLYRFASAMLIAVSIWNVGRCKRGCSGYPSPGAVDPKVATRYAEEYRLSGIKRDFGKAI